MIELIDMLKMKKKGNKEEMKTSLSFIIQKGKYKRKCRHEEKERFYLYFTGGFSILLLSCHLLTHKYRGILSVHHPCVVGYFFLDNLFESNLVPQFCRFDIGIPCGPIQCDGDYHIESIENQSVFKFMVNLNM